MKHSSSAHYKLPRKLATGQPCQFRTIKCKQKCKGQKTEEEKQKKTNPETKDIVPALRSRIFLNRKDRIVRAQDSSPYSFDSL
jgi:hypothetical protein